MTINNKCLEKRMSKKTFYFKKKKTLELGNYGQLGEMPGCPYLRMDVISRLSEKTSRTHIVLI